MDSNFANYLQYITSSIPDKDEFLNRINELIEKYNPKYIQVYSDFIRNNFEIKINHKTIELIGNI